MNGILSAEGILSWNYRYYWMAFLLVVLVVLVIALVVLRRRARAKKAGDLSLALASLPVAGERNQPRLQASSLVRIWKGFLREIPVEFRHSIEYFQPFVVFGEAGSGKSLLIDKYIDWQRQALQSCPSCTTDSLLQIYTGSRALVLELPAALLNDTSKQTHSALRALWKRLFTRRDPIVVITLNGAALRMESPESLKRQAQTIRGKINILSREHKKPVKTVLVLTHMDQVEGYLEFSQFLYQNGMPFHVNVNSGEDIRNMEHSMEKYESCLGAALTTLPSPVFLRVISFMREMPPLLSLVSSFIGSIQWNDPLSYKPEVIRLHFSAGRESDRTISDPFASPITDEEIRNIHPWRKHQVAGAALALAGCLYLTGSYFYEKQLLTDIDRSMDVLELHPPAQYNQDWHRLFLDWGINFEKDPFLAFLPNFFPNLDYRIRQRLLGNIRKLYLFPKLSHLGNAPYARERTLYLLGLIYATMHNDLGPFILEHPEKWVKALDVPLILVRDYITNNSLADLELNLGAMNLDNPRGVTPTEDPYPWLIFFRKASTAYQRDLITPEFLQELQREATPLLDTIEEFYRYDLCGKLAEQLKKVAPVGNRLDWIQTRDAAIKQDSLREFMHFVKGLSLTAPSAANLTLFRFTENVKVMMQAVNKEDKEYRFNFLGEEFVFSAGKWNELLNRSRITFFMRDFVSHNRRGGGQVFFGLEDKYPEIQMNPTNDGLMFFVGKGKVDGKLTRLAFEESVKPPLIALPDFLKSLPVTEEEKTSFSNFIYKEVESYAERYVASYKAYYLQFKVVADSMGGLVYVLNQIQLPNSQFQDFLATMKENTVLDLGDSPYLRPMGLKLGTFDFIRRLMADQKGVMPELEKFRAIMAQMQAELENTEPYVAGNPADDARELRAILTPAGRICLSIFRNEDGSYMKMVQMWLKSVGIAAEWQQPFVTPVQQAYAFGQTELEAGLNKMWNDMCESYLQPIVTKFPFDRKSESDIPLSELERVINPKGAFWKTFRDYLAPVCQETGHTWFERKSGFGRLRLPRDLLAVANDVMRISATLWDDKGEPKPLTFMMRPAPLPPMDYSSPVAVMAYLQAGKASVFAFNQQPTWQNFNLEWWKSHTAGIGVELEDIRDFKKSYKDLTIQESPWSFYHLLDRADTPDANSFRWKLENPVAGAGKPISIQFTSKSDPWAIFQLGRK